jgi:hypothetical protein
VSAGPTERSAEPERTARGHAERVAGRDWKALEDLAPGAEIAPPDLFAWLMGCQFGRAELVAHARIGDHHIFKTRFVGATTVVVQARWAADAGGRWLIREAEVARVEGARAGAPGPVSRPGEV